MAVPTPLGFELPTVGGDSNLWGNFLNDNWTLADTLITTNQTDITNLQTSLSNYLPLDGSQPMTGDLVLTEPSPTVLFTEGDQGVDLKQWAVFSLSSSFRMQPRSDAGTGLEGYLQLNRTSTGLTDATMVVVGNDPVAPVDSSVMTRLRTDNRYVQLSGSTMTGSLTMQDSQPNLIFRETDQGTDLKVWYQLMTSSQLRFQPRSDAGVAQTGNFTLHRDATGCTDATLIVVGDNTATPQFDSVITRRRGDARYVEQSNMQSGQHTGVANPSTVTFPSAFPNANVAVTANAIETGTNETIVTLTNVTATGFTYHRRGGEGGGSPGKIAWIASYYG